MNTAELFSGTKSFSKIAEGKGHRTYTVDNNEKLNPDLCIDMLALEPHMLSSDLDALWTSPPCTAFSVAAIGHHWTVDRKPKTEGAKIGLALLNKTVEIISLTKPKVWFIENPRGMMRKIIPTVFARYGIHNVARHTVTYCQYGDTRQKPTDIWTNCNIKFKAPCSPGASCHVAAPRGSRTGTQGLKDNKERSVIPQALMEHVVGYLEKNYNNKIMFDFEQKHFF